MTRRLTHHSPRRCTVRTATGFSSRPFGLLDVLSAAEAGAWFAPGMHDFGSAEASFAAYNIGDVLRLVAEVPNE